eukprot:129500-Hanusia_phi.AAC.1
MSERTHHGHRTVLRRKTVVVTVPYVPFHHRVLPLFCSPRQALHYAGVELAVAQLLVARDGSIGPGRAARARAGTSSRSSLVQGD